MKQINYYIKESILDDDKSLANREFKHLKIKLDERVIITKNDVNKFTEYIIDYFSLNDNMIGQYLFDWKITIDGWACDIYIITENNKSNDWVCTIGYCEGFVADYDYTPNTSKPTYKYIKPIVDKLSQFEDDLNRNKKVAVIKKFRYGDWNAI